MGLYPPLTDIYFVPLINAQQLFAVAFILQ